MPMSGIHLRKRIDEAKKAAAEAGGAIEETRRVYGFRLLRAGLIWGSTYVLSRGLLELSTITDEDVRVVILMTLGLLELAVQLNADDWSYRHIWALMPALYYAGLLRAKRRYL